MTLTLPPRPGARRYVAVPAVVPAAPPTPPRARDLRARAGLVVGLPLAALVVGLLLGLLLGLVVVAQRATTPSAPAALPPAPTAVIAAPVLAAAFPDVAALGPACTPFDPGAQGYTTSTGARAVAVVRCDHGAAVPGGGVYYTQWRTAADARQWQADQVAWGPALDGRARWDAAGRDQGPWHRRAGPDGTVYATAAYADRPYGFDVVTRSAQDTARVFATMRLLPADALPV